MQKFKSLLLFGAFAFAAAAFAEAEFKASDVNPLFVRGMAERPWWNADYKFRAPLLVSEPIGKRRECATLDFICDLGQKVAPESVRIVTPWEEEIPCQAAALDGNKIEIIFQASLREYEQKPFYIYCGSPASKNQEIDGDLVMKDKGKSIDIRNELIQAVFTADNKRSAKLKTFRIIGSHVPNQLTEMKTGVTWAGFDLGKIEFSEKPRIKTDGPLKKTIEYSSKEMLLEFTIYSFSPRIDFKITPLNAKTVSTVTKWVCGGGDAYDTFRYEGAKGPMQLKAGPDTLSDKNDVYPEETLTKWMKEGWAALTDKNVNESCGEFFDRSAMTYFNYYSQTINGGETFSVNFDLKAPVSGALTAMKGDWQEFRADYIEWKNPPSVSLGAVQPYKNIGYKIPSFTKDFTRSYMFWDIREGTRVTDDFAEWIVRDIRKLGGNSAKYNVHKITALPLSKATYDNFCKLFQKYYKEKHPQQFEEYDEAMSKNSYLEGLVKAAHDKGLPVRVWIHSLFWGWSLDSVIYDPDFTGLMIDINKIMAKNGVDLLGSCWMEGNEWAHVPPESGGAWGPFWEKYYAWFSNDQLYTDFTKRLHDEIKKDYPAVPINTLSSTDGWLRKEVFMDEKAPYLDTVENEFCPGMIPNMPQLKYGIKRMHGIFGNDGRSIQHHFYYYEPNPLWRVSEMELPMIFGVKSFAHESMLHDQNNPELNEITADFYRLTDYTALDKFIAGTTPYKFMAVFRDSDAFKDDIRNNRISLAFSQEQGEQESRCKQLVVIKNIPLDVLYNRFFKLDELKKYKLVFIPSDRVFSDDCAKILADYVKGGGCVISEGNTADNKLFAKLAGVKKTGDEAGRAEIAGVPVKAPLSVAGDGAEVLVKDAQGGPLVYINGVDKGKVIYSPYILTDDINNSKAKELFVRGLIVKLAGPGPVIPEESMLTAFDSSLLVSGNEYFLGVYNPGSGKALRADIKLDIPVPTNSFLLNVKTGARAPFSGNVKTDIAPLQTGFYIIGSDQATELPLLQKAVLAGGASSVPGMKFNERKTDAFRFEFTPAGKAKTLGVLHITNKSGRQDQAYGAEAIFNSLREGLPDVKVKYLENLEEQTINGCDAVIVPNMGGDLPLQLNADWPEIIAAFAGQGGGAMVIHHAIGSGGVGAPPFPSIGKWSGKYYAVNDFSVAKAHPVTEGMKTGEVFHDNSWDYFQVEPGEDGAVIALGLRKDGVPTPAMTAGKVGKGNVIVSGIGIGAGYRKENDKHIKYEAPPEGGLKMIMINSAKWMLLKETQP